MACAQAQSSCATSTASRGTVAAALQRARGGISGPRAGEERYARDAFFDVGEVPINTILAIEARNEISTHTPRRPYIRQFRRTQCALASGSMGCRAFGAHVGPATRVASSGPGTGRRHDKAASVPGAVQPAKPGNFDKGSAGVAAQHQDPGPLAADKPTKVGSKDVRLPPLAAGRPPMSRPPTAAPPTVVGADTEQAKYTHKRGPRRSESGSPVSASGTGCDSKQ